MLANLDPAGIGTVIAVNNWGSDGDLPGNNGGVYLSGIARTLYTTYQDR